MTMSMLIIILSYLLGSLSSAILLARATGLPDPRTVGSKNPGATNMLRVAGKKIALLIFLGDALKGIVAVALARILSEEVTDFGLAAVSVVLGHMYPIFFGFRGGKGIATAFGALVSISGVLGVLVLTTWIGVFWFSRLSSLAGLTAAVMAPFYTAYFLPYSYLWSVSMIAALVLWRHRSNIIRLYKGTEEKTKI